MATTRMSWWTPREVGWFPASGEVPTVRELLSGPGTRRWMVGAGIACLIVLFSNTGTFFTMDQPAWIMVLLWVHFLIFVAVFLLGPPLSWYRPEPFQVFMAVGFFALTVAFSLYPHSSLGATWMWTFVTVFIASQAHPRTFVLAAITVLCVSAFAINMMQGESAGNAFSQTITIGSVGLLMAAFSRQLAIIRQLRQTQHQLAELAVSEERSRVGRDMHDILGHSLTVIAVKAELAGRLLEVAPERAAAEIADLEDLARGALEDVRATVSGYRGVNILTELANARTALAAAGIDAELPGVADAVPAKHRELFGWVLREGITNVIRHAGATRCVVTLGPKFLQIDDDGVGPSGPASSGAGAGEGAAADGHRDGNGLKGAAERVEAAGAGLSVGRSELGGFRLRLQT
jgi:two-component system, NarL family, sensor histidine kinase DesK